MSHQSKRMDEFPLDNQRPSSHDAVLPITDNEQEVLVIPTGHPLVSGAPFFVGDVPDRSQDAENVEVAVVVV